MGHDVDDEELKATKILLGLEKPEKKEVKNERKV